MFISGNVTTFAVKRSDGNFDVGNLAKPDKTTVQPFAPEGAQLVDRSTFDAAKGNADALRRAVLGHPGVVSTTLDALHLHHAPLHKAEQLVEAAGSRIAAWSSSGRPDSVTAGGPMPGSLENASKSLEQLGTVVSQKSFKAEFLACAPEQRQQFMQRMGSLLDVLPKLDGVRTIGAELQGVADSVMNLNGFLVDTGAKRVATISAQTIGEATMIFGIHTSVSQLKVGTVEIE